MKETRFDQPLRKLSDQDIKDMDLKYYNTDVHRAAFVLPQFARRVRYYCCLKNYIFGTFR